MKLVYLLVFISMHCKCIIIFCILARMRFWNWKLTDKLLYSKTCSTSTTGHQTKKYENKMWRANKKQNNNFLKREIRIQPQSEPLQKLKMRIGMV